MPSFDVVSEVNHHELSNAVDQANREVATRFDFKGTGSNFELNGSLITLNTESEFQLQQMYDMLCNKLVKRGGTCCKLRTIPRFQFKPMRCCKPQHPRFFKGVILTQGTY